MNLFKKEPEPITTFDRLILEEQYAEAFAFAIDNKIEQEALKICIQYIQEDNEKTEPPTASPLSDQKYFINMDEFWEERRTREIAKVADIWKREDAWSREWESFISDKQWQDRLKLKKFKMLRDGIPYKDFLYNENDVGKINEQWTTTCAVPPTAGELERGIETMKAIMLKDKADCELGNTAFLRSNIWGDGAVSEFNSKGFW